MSTYINEVNPHLALWQSENYVSPRERQWDRFHDAVAAALQIADLDGEQDDDGYSIDMAYDMFAANLSADEAVEQFRAEIDAIAGGR